MPSPPPPHPLIDAILATEVSVGEPYTIETPIWLFAGRGRVFELHEDVVDPDSGEAGSLHALEFRPSQFSRLDAALHLGAIPEAGEYEKFKERYPTNAMLTLVVTIHRARKSLLKRGILKARVDTDFSVRDGLGEIRSGKVENAPTLFPIREWRGRKVAVVPS